MTNILSRLFFQFLGLALLFLSVLKPVVADAQVGPQGQDGRWVLWGVLQVDQAFAKKWNSTSVVGVSSRSEFEGFEPTKDFGVLGVRQEFSCKLNKHFTFGVGAFYSAIGLAGQKEPHPDYLNEIRLYPRVYYTLQRPKWRLAVQLRVDLRYFSEPFLAAYEKPFEFRLRLTPRFFLPFNAKETVTFILTTDFLAPTRYLRPVLGADSWTPFKVAENRTSVFFRFKISPHLALDLGGMFQARFPVAGNPKALSYYAAAGLIIKNPLDWLKKRREAKKKQVNDPPPDDLP